MKGVPVSVWLPYEVFVEGEWLRVEKHELQPDGFRRFDIGITSVYVHKDRNDLVRMAPPSTIVSPTREGEPIPSMQVARFETFQSARQNWMQQFVLHHLKQFENADRFAPRVSARVGFKTVDVFPVPPKRRFLTGPDLALLPQAYVAEKLPEGFCLDVRGLEVREVHPLYPYVPFFWLTARDVRVALEEIRRGAFELVKWQGLVPENRSRFFKRGPRTVDGSRFADYLSEA